MGNFKDQILHEFRCLPQSISSVWVVFLCLMTAFGILLGNTSGLWEPLLPSLLMGLSYGLISLSLGSLFREDWEDGTLEWVMSEGHALEFYVFKKVIVYWICVGIPLTLMAGFLSGFMSFRLILGMGMTTLVVTFLGAIGSALCLTMKAERAFILLLLTLPLGIPMMIVSMASMNSLLEPITSYFLLQMGLLFMASSLSLLACPFALRLSLR